MLSNKNNVSCYSQYSDVGMHHYKNCGNMLDFVGGPKDR